MSLLQGTVTAGRRWAEARMLDACTIASETESVDPESLEPTVTTDEQYSGVCRLSSRSQTVSDREVGGQSFAEQDLILSVPVAGAAPIRTNAVVTITAVDAVAGDPSLVGQRFRVSGRASGSQATAARFPVVWIS